jgi:putative ABC transport system permease protein
LDTLLKDFRYAGRGLFRTPGVSIVAVLALALGVGLTAIMFSIVYGALHRGLPFEGADRIMSVARSIPSLGVQVTSVPVHDYLDYRERQRSFEDLAAFYQGTVNIRGPERPDRYDGAFMSANAFEVVGAQPLLGRGFRPDDTTPGSPMVAILGYRVWQERYGGSRDVLGMAVTVNGEPGEIVGVMPEDFRFPVLQEVWVPLRLDALALPRGEGTQLSLFGRLREGVTVDAAMVEFTGIARQLEAEHPETNEGVVPVIRPYTDQFIGDDVARLLYTMLATVALVLLIACANVANLLLARAAVRTRDVAIRTAMGASRWRVVVQLMAEALVLAAVGAALGTAIAWVGIGLFDRAVQPTDPPFWLEFKLDGPIVLFVVVVTGVAALVSGALPAVRASATDVNTVLKDESRGSSSLQLGRLSRGLVVAEVAMSVALLVASGLMVKSVVTLGQLDYGFPTQDVFTARIGLFEGRYPAAEDRQRVWDEIEARAAELSGVRSAALVDVLPGLGGNGGRVALEGVTYTADRDLPTARWARVTPGFFETFEVAVLQGRAFTTQDTRSALQVAVVNESFVRRHFPDGQALGRRVRVGGLESPAPWREIVGVVPDLRLEGVGNTDAPPPDGFYIPLAQDDSRFVSLALRGAGAPLALSAPVRDLVAGVDADTPIYFVRTLQAAIDENLWFYRVFGGLFAAFGVAALFLASVGLFGVMSFSVSRRVPEMGIRMALGAEAGQVRGLVLRQGMRQMALGMLLGTGLAVLVARGLQMVVYGSRPWDPATYATVFALLTLTGLAATLVPALRATRVDPVQALRSE